MLWLSEFTMDFLNISLVTSRTWTKTSSLTTSWKNSALLKAWISPSILNHWTLLTPHSDQLIVQLKCYNQYGVEIKTNVNENSQEFVNQNVCILRIQLRNLKSTQSNELLGSVVFCDTFYIQSGAYHVLTKNVPYFKCWTIDPTSSESIDKVKDVIISEELGKPTSNGKLFYPKKIPFIFGRIWQRLFVCSFKWSLPKIPSWTFRSKSSLHSSRARFQDQIWTLGNPPFLL